MIFRYQFHSLWKLFLLLPLLTLSLQSSPSLSHAATYQFDDTVIYAWVNTTTAASWTESACSDWPGDDDAESGVPLGFTFTYGGVDYTTVRVVTNGALHFGADQEFHTDWSNEAMPITTAVAGPCGAESPADRVIAPYWTDLAPDYWGTVNYDMFGTAPNRRFVASWNGVPDWYGGVDNTTQVILYEGSNNIKFQYDASSEADGSIATIGVEIDDTDFTEYSFNTATVGNSGPDAILFYNTHFSISHDGIGATSTPEQITITTHIPPHTAYTGLNNGSDTNTITLNTSTAHGDWSISSGAGTLVNNGNGNATYTFAAADNGQVVLDLTNTFVETLNINITSQYGSEDASEDADLTFLSPSPPHFAISHDGSGNACAPENITITKHDASHATDTGYTGTITLSTSTAHGDWSVVSGTPANLTNSGNGAATYIFDAADNGQIILGLANTFTETLNINITDGSDSEDPAEDPSVVFSNTVTGTFRDEFNAISYTNSDGTLAWASDWTEINEGDGPTNGDLQVVTDGGNYSLRIKDNGSGGGEGVQRIANLSGYTSATLTFDYRRQGLDNVNDNVTVAVYNNSTLSWDILDTFAGSGTDAAYQTPASAPYDISSYIANNTTIRLFSSTTLGNNDIVYFDNVEIAVSGPLVCPADHFAISHDGTAYTGTAEDITITAHYASHTTATGYTGTITLSTSTAHGDWSVVSGTPANLTNSGNGAATYTFDAADNGQVILGLTNTFVETLNINITDTTISEDSGEDADLTFTLPPSTLKMESGAVNLPITAPATFTAVTFQQSYSQPPVVIALPEGDRTNPSDDPSTIRIRNVTTTGFEMAQVEPPNEDGSHGAMTVHYLAVTAGSHTLPDGTSLEAGFHDTTTVQHGTGVVGAEGYDVVTFNQPFGANPVVLTQIQSMNNEVNSPPGAVSVPWLTTAIRTNNITTTDFETALERSEVNNGTVSVAERIGYIAIDADIQGSFTDTGGATVNYETITTGNTISGWDNGCYTTNFINIYAAVPNVLADKRGHRGGDGGWLRRCSLSTAQIGLTVEEDRDRDSERSHIAEPVSIAVFSGNFVADFTSPTIDHYVISHSGNGVTCEAEPVTITGHDGTHTVIVIPAATTIILSTSSNQGDWTLNTGAGTLNNGTADDGAATYTFPGGESSVILDLAHPYAGTIDIDVTGTVSAPDDQGSEDPQLTFSDAGFRFYGDGGGGPVYNTIGLQIGGKPSYTGTGADTLSQSLTIRAVQTNTDTGECIARIQGATTVDMAYECVDPTTCSAGKLVGITSGDNNTLTCTGGTPDGSPITGNNLGAGPVYDAVSLTFDGSGNALFTMIPCDVGQIRLYAKKDIAASGSDPAVTLLGTSNDFISRPFAVDVTVSGNPAATSSVGAAFIAAGSNMTVTAEAVLWETADDSTTDGIADNHNDTDPSNNAVLTDNPPAKNFGRETTAEGITIASLLDQPIGGNDPGLSGTTGVTGFTNGTASTTVQFIEVGIIEISSSITDGNYLGIEAPYAGETAEIVGRSGYVGRFTPDYFDVSSNSPVLADGCPAGNFTYLGESFGYNTGPSITITALNVGDTTTQNYEGNFWKLGEPFTLNYSYTDNSATGLTLTPSATSVTAAAGATTNCNGSLTVNPSNTFTYPRPAASSPQAPFGADIDLDIAAAEFTDTDSICYDTGTGCLAFTVANITGTDLRHGRIKVYNNYGPETADITGSVYEIQYYDGTGWIVNSNDSCTAEGTLGFCAEGTHTAAVDTGSLSAGAGTLTVTTTGTAETIQACPTAPADLTSLSVCTAANAMCGNFTFGIFRGNDRIINWQEIVR